MVEQKKRRVQRRRGNKAPKGTKAPKSSKSTKAPKSPKGTKAPKVGKKGNPYSHPPTPTYTSGPAHKPTQKPTPKPTGKKGQPYSHPPTPTYTSQPKPTHKPTHKPTPVPSGGSTPEPTKAPTAKPTGKPTDTINKGFVIIETADELEFNCQVMDGVSPFGYSDELIQVFSIEASLCVEAGVDLEALKLLLLSQNILPLLAQELLDCQFAEVYEFSSILWDKVQIGDVFNREDQDDGSICYEWNGVDIVTRYFQQIVSRRRRMQGGDISDMTLATLFFTKLIEALSNLEDIPGLVSCIAVGFGNVQGAQQQLGTFNSNGDGDSSSQMVVGGLAGNEPVGFADEGPSVLSVLTILVAAALVAVVAVIAIRKMRRSREPFSFDDKQNDSNSLVDEATTVDEDLDAAVLKEVEEYDHWEHESLEPSVVQKQSHFEPRREEPRSFDYAESVEMSYADSLRSPPPKMRNHRSVAQDPYPCCGEEYF